MKMSRNEFVRLLELQPRGATLVSAFFDAVASIDAEVAQLRPLKTVKLHVDTLFAAIAHGDPQHRDWLYDALAAHFAGQPVPKPVLKEPPSVQEANAATQEARKELAAAKAELLEERALNMNASGIEHERTAAAESALVAMRLRKDSAFHERNQCVVLIVRMALALGWRAGIRSHEDKPGEAWDPEWRSLVCIDLPSGQVSWHLHDSHKYLLEGLPAYTAPWDGHDTLEKYRRVKNTLVEQQPVSRSVKLSDAVEAIRARIAECGASLPTAPLYREDRVNHALTRVGSIPIPTQLLADLLNALPQKQ